MPRVAIYQRLYCSFKSYIRMSHNVRNNHSDTCAQRRLKLTSFANSGDPDQTPHSAASDLGLHCLPISHSRSRSDIPLPVWGDFFILGRSISAQCRFWSDCAKVRAALTLCRAQSSVGTTPHVAASNIWWVCGSIFIRIDNIVKRDIKYTTD